MDAFMNTTYFNVQKALRCVIEIIPSMHACIIEMFDVCHSWWTYFAYLFSSHCLSSSMQSYSTSAAYLTEQGFVKLFIVDIDTEQM